MSEKQAGYGKAEDQMARDIEQAKEGLAHTIAKMTEGLMRTHMISLPPGSHKVLESRAMEFMTMTHGVDIQIGAQLAKSMTRPPAA